MKRDLREERNNNEHPLIPHPGEVDDSRLKGKKRNDRMIEEATKQ